MLIRVKILMKSDCKTRGNGTMGWREELEIGENMPEFKSMMRFIQYS